VKLNFPPAGILPESNALVSLVAVCAMLSVFVHVTIVPTDTLMGFGAYAAEPSDRAPDGIVTAEPEGDGVGVGVGVVGVDELPHATAVSRRQATRTYRRTDIEPLLPRGLLNSSDCFNSNHAARFLPRVSSGRTR
jgi:hypothetical protein